MKNRKKEYFLYITVVAFLWLYAACDKPETPVQQMFQALDSDKTGLSFTNKLAPTNQFNIFKYLYFYNGAGIGAGDFNNDGKTDLFFAANQSDNKLYLNKGQLRFTDVTAEAKIPEDGGWSTGVSVIDINNDGLLDIYVCRVGKYEILNSHNQLLICQGIDRNGVPTYKDEAAAYGLDFSGFCTQAVFFDYDGDGDLDMYLLNHSIHQNGTFGVREQLLKVQSPLSGDRIFQNNNNKFTDVTKQTGINSSVLEYGLGITVSDINLDGYPDIYSGNDFHENDYLYINQHNGTFKDDLSDCMMHTSQFSMGVDIADLNNDAAPEIISMDMLPSDPEILKRSLGEDEYDLFYEKLGYGYNYQYTRNNLQLNRCNGMFSEVGLYAGVAATDWSWAPLLMDFDNDGLKDIFISNGISKRLNDIDYINYVSDKAIQAKMNNDKLDENDMLLINKFPQNKVPNRFFKNKGDMVFKDVDSQVLHDDPTYSNGAVYADFDNDGDLDIVVNNVDAPAILYENNSNDKKDKPFVEVKLKGSEKNINAAGSKIIVYAGNGIRTYEKYPVRGFLSSMETALHIGLDKTNVDSVLLIWPDNTYQHIQLSKADSFVSVNYQKNLPAFNYKSLSAHWKNETTPMEDITAKTDLLYKPQEDAFQEFNRQPLIPHMISTEGPAIAVSDINGDGLQDVFIGSSKRKKSAVFLQQASGKFYKAVENDIDKDSTYEDVDACLTDVNKDGFPDLVIASGGNDYYGKDPYLTPRVYLNDGKAVFTKLNNVFDSLFINASCVVPYDFNGDGYMDLFIGGRSVPWEYGQVPHSCLLQNNGKGGFVDVTAKIAQDLAQAGFVTRALWFDIDKDGDKDLLLSTEWGCIEAFLNNKGIFTRKILCDKKGWWNFILPVDINNDGNIDIIAGNLGLNSRLKASENEPVRLYYYDFDGNGKKEQVLTYYLNDKEYPFNNKGELEKQMPVIRKHFLYAEDFAKSSLTDIFTQQKLKAADTLTANFFSNSVLINKGNLNFSVQPMPWQAQLSPFKDAVAVDANGDSLPDILLMGNYYENNIQMGRYDADFGTILLNKGNGQFAAGNINGLQVKGQVRHIAAIDIGGKQAYIVDRNNDSTMVIQFKK